MNPSARGFTVPVDLRNPGQFFACCGLLEVAHRLWSADASSGGAEAWFNAGGFSVEPASPSGGACNLSSVVRGLTHAGVRGELSTQEAAELDGLEEQKRTLRKDRKSLPDRDEERRVALGKKQREGAIQIGAPVNLRLSWWQEDGEAIPKTFAGKQEALRMALAMLDKAPTAAESTDPLAYRAVLSPPRRDHGRAEGSRPSRRGARRAGPKTTGGKVEPFYFDANRFAHALDVGFSLDAQERNLRATAAPLTELFALVGLQRFRPRLSCKWTFDYFSWLKPLSPAVAAGAVSGAIALPGAQAFRFRLQFRDDQKRYKAFGFASPLNEKGETWPATT